MRCRICKAIPYVEVLSRRLTLTPPSLADSAQFVHCAAIGCAAIGLRQYDLGDTIPFVKVAISLPDPVFQAAENLAKRLKKPRSRLYAEAIAEYVGAHGSTAVTERLNAVYEVEPSAVGEAWERAQTKSVSNEAW